MDPSKGVHLAILQVHGGPSKGIHLASLSGAMVDHGGTKVGQGPGWIPVRVHPAGAIMVDPSKDVHLTHL